MAAMVDEDLDNEAEAARQAVLDGYRIVDTLEERAFDEIAELAALICQAPTALISFLDHDRQWFKARHGTSIRQIKRAQSFCAHAVRAPDDVVMVRDATMDPRFAGNPLVTGEPHIRFYAGAPLVTAQGAALGALCVLDQVRRDLTPAQRQALAILSRQVMTQLELRRSNAALEVANARLAAQGLTDGLTCIPNRRAFNRRMAEEQARATRSGEPLSLMLVDIDHFKSYNDAFGHPAGDEALFRVAQTLHGSARPYDFAARYGGEEFAIILPRTNRPAALAAAERLRAAIAKQRFLRRVTVSVGVATLQGQADGLLEAADRALYDAKAAGRDRVAAA